MSRHPLGMVASSAILAALLLAAAPQLSRAQLGGAPSAFLGQLGAAPGANGSTPAAPVCKGKTPAKLIIESITPLGENPEIVIRNIGGQTANITGYRLAGTTGGSNQTNKDQMLYIAQERRCSENGTIASGQSKAFKPRSATNACGYQFNLGPSGSVTLSDYNDAPVSRMSWTDAQPGTQIHVTPDGSSAVRVPGNKSVIDVLNDLGDYSTFLLALQSTGIDKQLQAASDPTYAGPVLPEEQYNIDLPWWFAGAQGATAAPPPPPPPAPVAPPPAGIPEKGPYTILAPTDEAFDNLLTNMGGGQKLPLDALLRLPQLKDILLYHIVPGEYTSQYLRNNTPIYTAKGVEVVPFADGCMTEGKLMLHDSCIDKPTGDNYTCTEQKQFQKCDFPFMRSALAAQWQGGYCQRTCERCDCSPASGIQCSVVQSADIQASNGVIQSISRVLFPPPVFSKADAVAAAVAYNASLARNQSLGIAAAPGMLGLNDATGLPGAAAPINPAVTPGGVGPTALPGAGGAGGASPRPAGAEAAPAAATPASPQAADGAPPASPAAPPAERPAAGAPAGKRRRLHNFNRKN